MTSSLNRFKREVAEVKVQGASAVAVATLEALGHFFISTGAPRNQAAWAQLVQTAQELAAVRPTEPMARNLASWFVAELAARAKAAGDGKFHWQAEVGKLQQELHYRVKEIEAHIARLGSALVRSKQTIFTHCHSSLAEGILVRARQAGKSFMVYHTETRPLFQGRITERHLRRARITSVMVADSAAAWLISNHSGDDVQVDWVLLGADSIGKDGSVMNKIGSFAIALSAYDSGIPLYVAATLLKFDSRSESHIELRPRDELWPGAPKGTQIINYAFDRIPAQYITAYVTEVGLVKPKDFAKAARQQYPWLGNKINR
ncbi:MAG: translation initiation factor eIF-2B [Candidatus Veblenbacteria bacterium]|nr:translation initiation factor eIF-2B [Candidatus Veblenbacteria bacterium]MDZ4229554.1 translation initiation factor eIF-2B [Candidatus Veblenbacteria bacterium]